MLCFEVMLIYFYEIALVEANKLDRLKLKLGT